jgi:hypothetical protein
MEVGLGPNEGCSAKGKKYNLYTKSDHHIIKISLVLHVFLHTLNMFRPHMVHHQAILLLFLWEATALFTCLSSLFSFYFTTRTLSFYSF